MALRRSTPPRYGNTLAFPSRHKEKSGGAADGRWVQAIGAVRSTLSACDA